LGLIREPKWSHLRDLHKTLKLTKNLFLTGTRKVQDINKFVQIVTYEKPESKLCAAFLSNRHKKVHRTVDFRGKQYFLSRRSVTILPNCKNIMFNTELITSQHNSRTFVPSKRANNFKWETYRESIPTYNDLSIQSKSPLELTGMTKDTTDYMWYSTSLNLDKDDLPMRPDILSVIRIQSLGDALLAFVNGQYIGFGHGSFIEKSFTFSKPVSLKVGINHISILAMTVGLPNSGAYMEKRFAGIRAVILQGMSTGTLDITLNQWGHRVGVEGEAHRLFTEEGSKKAKWAPASGPGTPITWYKTRFQAPEGNNPVAIKMERMGKGVIWINGYSIGRYWDNYRSPLGAPSQTEYHVPRSYLKPKNNLLVVYEESSGSIDGIVINTVNRDIICSLMLEDYPPNLDSWKIENGVFKPPAAEKSKPSAQLTCDPDKFIKEIQFVGFGNPWGSCGSYMQGTCQASNAKKVVEKACLGKNSCRVPIDRAVLGEPTGDPSCVQEKVKKLAIQRIVYHIVGNLILVGVHHKSTPLIAVVDLLSWRRRKSLHCLREGLHGLERLSQRSQELWDMGLIGLNLVGLGLIVWCGYDLGLVNKSKSRTSIAEMIWVSTIETSSRLRRRILSKRRGSVLVSWSKSWWSGLSTRGFPTHVAKVTIAVTLCAMAARGVGGVMALASVTQGMRAGIRFSVLECLGLRLRL
ncbi:beta-galactosidase 14-like, partial [Bidens hawaiensis]|uniref:beta-galactosidase 14-like n=1 Tax=Bidens hawaiensis TaxID=980011 RepID=UPI00404A71C1